jgi:hypothetical protein
LTDQDHDGRWLIAQRWQEYYGEQRAAVLRLVAIAAFYAVELMNYHGLSIGPLEMPPAADVTQKFHQSVTALAVAWTTAGIGVLLCLRNRIFPRWLKYASTLIDLALLTSVLVLADGPRSPLVVAYFVVIALAGVRFSLPLVRCATVGSMFCYLYLNGFARWFTEREIGIPRYHQFIVLIALLMTGLIVGQVLRLVRTLVESADAPAGAPGDAR